MATSRDDLARAAARAMRFSWDASARAWFDAWCSIAR
jgi:hypothetical protein